MIEGVARTASVSARMISRPVASPPAWTMRLAAMRGLEAEQQARRLRIAVEADAERARSFDRRRRRRDDALRRPRDRKAHRRRRAYRRDAAPDHRRARPPPRRRLAPRALDVSAPSGALRQQHDRLRRQMQRRHQPGDAAADDDGHGWSMHRVHDDHPRAHTASIRLDGAPGAVRRSAGSIVTSCCIVLERAADVLRA